MIEDRDRQQLLVEAVLKVLGVALAIGVVIGIGSYVFIKAVGLDDVELSTSGPPPVGPITAPPTTALPVPTEAPTDDTPPTGLVTTAPTATNTGGLYVSASPVFVSAMERINLTGQWPGHDAMGLMVQRQEDGEWVDFGVQTTVRVGTFETYVMTGRSGDNVFRVFDPESNTASNEVTVTVQ